MAIIDTNIVGELWDKGGNPAGQGFRRAVDDGRIPLVLGGSKMKQELGLDSPGTQTRLKAWIQQLQVAGRLRRESDSTVDSMTRRLELGGGSASQIGSNDHHVIALAVLSGVRLLYTNDQKLTSDFRNRQVVEPPRGRVYSTRLNTDFNRRRRDLLARTDLCTGPARATRLSYNVRAGRCLRLSTRASSLKALPRDR